jgi:hypothetical protein
VFYVLLRALSGNRPLMHHADVPVAAGGGIKPLPAAPIDRGAS